jgi:hypothetical protein
MQRKIIIVIGFFLLISSFCSAQNNGIVNDSTTVYHDIHNFSKKSSFSKAIYKLIFRPSALHKTVNRIIEPNYRPDQNIYKGKIIRNINIKTLDPFGYSVSDSTKVPMKKVENFGNHIHVKTKKLTIKNLLLFKRNDPYDPLFISESERLIRSQRYIRRVKINTIELPHTKDSVDIDVVALDTWSLIPNGNLSEGEGTFNLKERNVLGLGHQLYGRFKERFIDREKNISGRYTINNIKNSYLELTLNYENDFDNNSVRSTSLQRRFFSPLTKWAGGVYFENRTQSEEFSQIIVDSIVVSPTKSEYGEIWAGHSFRLSDKMEYRFRATKLITSLTLNQKKYFESPPIEIDPYAFFSNEKNAIFQVGLTSQKYYQDKFIFNYDLPEDVPYGKIMALKVGYQDKNNLTRWYFGSKFAYGKKLNIGYLSGAAEWGSFYDDRTTQEIAFRMEFTYFTNLFYLGKWRIRQFVKPSYIWGTHRNPSEKDQLTLNDNLGIPGFESLVTGTQKGILSLQTQTYTPGSWHGFRFSPYLNMTFGVLPGVNTDFFNSRMYSNFGIGVLINNDYLVFNHFQISFSYYPSIPLEGTNIFKTNSFENTDLSLPEFQLSKPEYIRYE